MSYKWKQNRKNTNTEKINTEEINSEEINSEEINSGITKSMWKKSIRKASAWLLIATILLSDQTMSAYASVISPLDGENKAETGVSENEALVSGNMLVSENEALGSDENLEYLNDGVMPDETEIESLERTIGRYDENDVSVYSLYDEDILGATLPSSYDSRNASGVSYTNTPRNQGSSNLCWAFSSLGVMESNMIKKGYMNANEYQLAPDHLAYFFYHHVDDDLGLLSGQSVQIDKAGKTYFTLGGNAYNASFALADWIGAADESDAPFKNTEQTHSNALAYEDMVHMRNAYWLKADDNSYIKQMIKEKGAVTVNCKLSASGIKSCEDGTASYLYVGSGSVGHAVNIIGWDDNYPKENFQAIGGSSSENGQPASEDGAWLVKDSYMDEGNRVEGCFYMSYEDATLHYGTNKAISYDVDSAERYDHNYQYDGTFGIKNFGYDDEACGANVYEVKGNHGRNEILKAVSFSSSTINIDYEIKIYSHLTNPSKDPTDGILETTQSGSMLYAGIHTIELDDPVLLEANDAFSVVVSIQKPGDTCVMMTDESYSNGWAKFTSAAKPGISYYGNNENNLKDAYNRIYNGNSRPSIVRIKAFTTDIAGADADLKWIDADMVAGIPDMTYTGEQLRPEPEVTYGNAILVKDRDYTLTYGSNASVGKASGVVTITGIGKYATKVPIVVNFNIVKKSIDDSDMEILGLEDIYYTGKNLTPVSVKHGLNTLNTSAVSITYKNNLNAGTASVTIAGKGNYCGTVKKTFTILPRNLNDEVLNYSDVEDYPYSNKYIQPNLEIRNRLNGDTLLKNNTDYTIAYYNNLMPGTAEIIVTGKKNYTGVKKIEFTIQNIDLSRVALGTVQPQIYTGGVIEPSVVLTNGKTRLLESIDYTLTYLNNLNVGTATIKIEGKEGTVYAGSQRTTTFEILPANLSGATLLNYGDVTYKAGTTTYTQNEIKGDPNALKVVLPGGYVLTKGVDYNVSYSNNICRGNATATATMTITAAGGNVSGKITRNFRIVTGGKILLNDYTNNNLVITGFSENREYLYDTYDRRENANKKICPELRIYYKGNLLTPGKDYTLSYRNCDKIGTATVNITAVTGSIYSGTREERYYIIARPIFTKLGGLDNGFSMRQEPADCVYTGKLLKPEVVISEVVKRDGKGEKYTSLKEGRDYTLEYKNNLNVGRASCTLTGIGNYSGSHVFYFNITKRDISTLSNTKIKPQTYTGREIRPEVYLKCDNSYMMQGTDYEVLYGNNINAGIAAVTFEALPDSVNFTGSKTISFKINPMNLKNFELGEEITGLTDTVYTGVAQTPTPTISFNGIMLSPNECLVTYGNNLKIGKAKVTIKANSLKNGGSGNFTGSKTVNFQITGKPLLVPSQYPGDSFVYSGKTLKPALPVITDLNHNELKNGVDYKLSYSKQKDAGTGIIKIIGRGAYLGSTATMTYQIDPLDVSDAVINISNIKTQTLGTKTSVKPTFKIKINGATLKIRRDYLVTYTRNTAPGTGLIKITFVGNYTGKTVKEFTIQK